MNECFRQSLELYDNNRHLKFLRRAIYGDNLGVLMFIENLWFPSTYNVRACFADG